MLLNGKLVANVYLKNGSGITTVPAGTQTGTDSVQVQVTTPHYLQGSTSVTVLPEPGPTFDQIVRTVGDGLKLIGETLKNAAHRKTPRYSKLSAKNWPCGWALP